MNKKQKIVFLVGLGIIVLMGLIPPWSDSYSGESFYDFLFSSPAFWRGGRPTIDFTRLFLQWAVVVIATAGIIFILKDNNAGSQK
jgi:hypothetical protein